MASTISVPTVQQMGNYPPKIAEQVAAVASAASTDIAALQAGTTLSAQVGPVHTVRCVITTNIADLTSVTVASRDGLTLVAGDRVLLVKQTTASQDGIYVVGTVATGSAPFTRATDWAASAVLAAGSEVLVNEGTAWAGSRWYATLAGAITVGTSAPAFYPRTVKGTTVAMTAGSVAVSNTWILHATNTVVMLTAKATGGTMGALYPGTLTTGAGSGSFTITSSSNTDTSTVGYVIFN